MDESHIFEAEMEQGEAERFPAIEVFKRNPRALLAGAGLRFGENLSYYVAAIFAITYFTEIRGGSRELILNAVLIGSALEVVTMPVFAWLSDKVGRRPVYLFGAVGVIASFLFFFTLLDVGSMAAVTLAISAVMVTHGAMYAPQGAFIAELFPTRLRYSGASIAYQATSIVAGSLAPIIALSLYQAYHATWPIVAYVVIGCIVSGIAALLSRETVGIELHSASEG